MEREGSIERIDDTADLGELYFRGSQVISYPGGAQDGQSASSSNAVAGAGMLPGPKIGWLEGQDDRRMVAVNFGLFYGPTAEWLEEAFRESEIEHIVVLLVGSSSLVPTDDETSDEASMLRERSAPGVLRACRLRATAFTFDQFRELVNPFCVYLILPTAGTDWFILVNSSEDYSIIAGSLGFINTATGNNLVDVVNEFRQRHLGLGAPSWIAELNSWI